MLFRSQWMVLVGLVLLVTLSVSVNESYKNFSGTATPDQVAAFQKSLGSISGSGARIYVQYYDNENEIQVRKTFNVQDFYQNSSIRRIMDVIQNSLLQSCKPTILNQEDLRIKQNHDSTKLAEILQKYFLLQNSKIQPTNKLFIEEAASRIIKKGDNIQVTQKVEASLSKLDLILIQHDGQDRKSTRLNSSH